MNRNRPDDERTPRIVTLDFNGGSHVYRNPDLGMNIPVRIAPSGISADRARMLMEALNKDCADSHVRFEVGETSAEKASTVRIGRTADFDRYGAFLGLAEGIGSGDAFVLLDDSANDAELVDVIRHEAGHILGTLDHGGAGLARYGWHKDYTTYSGTVGPDYRSYLAIVTTRTTTYKWLTPPSDAGDIWVQYHGDGTEIDHDYRTYNPHPGETVYLDPPETAYYTYTDTHEAYRNASGIRARSISVRGGSVSGCTVEKNLSVESSYDYDETLYYPLTDPGRVRYYNYQYYYGSAVGCRVGGTLSVLGGCVARQCEAGGISVGGSRLEQSYDSTLAPDSTNGDDRRTFSYARAQAENCNVTGGNLIVGLGGEARNIIVKSGGAVIGNDISINTWYNGNSESGGFPAYDEAGRAELKTELENYGAAKVTNLIVEVGSVTVNYGGELYGADINGSLTFSEGAVISGVITCKGVMLWEDVVPQTNINIKIDLHDYAVPNYTEEIKDEQGRVVKVIDYFANYTTKIYSYTYFSDGARKESITTGTFNNNDGRFDMTNWKYRFSADIGQLEYASALPYILVDLGGTEKDFDEGWIGFYYPTANSDLELNISGDKRKWEEQWGHINGADSPIGFLGSIAYNAALYGEAADVLWLEFGEDPEVDYTIDLASEMAGASKDLTVTYAATGAETLTDAKIQGATLVVKGSDVESANLKVQATDSGKRDHECDLELLVVPESIPIIGKEGTKKYAAMLKKAQKNHITTEINDILPYNIHTKLFGMSFDLTNMGISLKVNWTEPSMTLKLQGKMEWALGKGTAGTGKQLKLVVDLSGDNYISITCRGKNSYSWDLVGELKAPDFKIGKFEFSNMSLKVNKEQASFSASAYVKLPWIKYSFGGSIGIVDGYLDSMSIGVDGLNVPLGTSGLFLQKIEGGISGIATELNLSFEGTLGLTAGPKFSVEFVDWLGIDDGEYSLCELTLSGSISTAGNLKGSASITILGGLATGSGSASFDGSAITVTGSFTFLNGCISIEGKLNAASGGITIDGKGTATVPRERIFGPLAGLGMSANVSAVVKQDASDSYVMAWQQVELFGNTFTIGFKSTFEGDVTLLGSTDLLKVENRNLRLLKGTVVQSYSVGDGMRGASPSASEKYIVSEAGVTFFQVSFSVSSFSPCASIIYDGVEYTQEAIAAGQHENMQIVGELTGENSVTIAVNNASLGEWTINAYGDEKAILGAYTFSDAVTKPAISAVEVGEGKRSATIRYALGDLSAENATISIFRSDSVSTEFTGAKIAEFSASEATGVFEYAPDDDLPGGSYSFYLMVTSDKLAPSYSDRSAACEFITVDTEAPDQIQAISNEWKSSGSVVTWDESWDDQGVAGYKIRYTTGDEDMAEIDVKTNTFTFDKVPNGTYDFQVAAYDEAGNLSAWSEMQSCMVLTAANAKYKDATLTNGLDIAEYESAVNITGGDFAVTAAANSLISGSTLTDAGIAGIVENTAFNGTVTLYDGAQGYGLTVNGELTVGGVQPEPEVDITKVEIQPEEGGDGGGELGGGDGTESPVETPMQDEAAEAKKGAFADGVTVRDGGVLTIEADSEVRNITVEAGGSLALKDDAVYDQVSLAYGAGLSFVGGNSSIYRLTGDIWTAGTLGTYRTISGGGHKIHFEQYRQTDELVVSELYSHDDIAFLPDMDKLSGKVLDIVIDSTVYGQYKIADKAAYFDGAITVTDHASGVSAEVGFDQYTLVGKALCKFRKDENNALYLTTERAEISAPAVTVDNAGSDQHESAIINVTPADDSGMSKKFSYRYSANADMKDAIVVEGDEGLFTGSIALLLNKDDLVNNGTYYVQACVENIYGVASPWSEAASFTVVQMVRPDAPATLTVTGATNKDSNAIGFTASGVDDSNYTVREYRFRYADNPEMKNAITIATGQRLINYAYIDKSDIEDGKDYYVQAGVKQINTWSYWTDAVVFNTRGYDYENITIGPAPDGDFNYFSLDGKRAKNVTVIDGGYFYGGGDVDGLTVEAGGFFRDDGAAVTNAVINGGEYWLSEGSVTDIVVNGGKFILRDGALNGATIGVNATMDLSSHYMPTITGAILIQGQFTIYYLHPGIRTNAEFVFDVGAHEANKDKSFVDYIYALGGASKFTAKLDDTPEIGEYRIASLYQVPENGLSVSLSASDGTDLGMMQIGGDAIAYNGLYYSLIDQKGTAYLHVSDNQDPPFIGAVKLSKGGAIYDSDTSYVDLSVSASDECDHVLVGDGGQVHSITVGDGGSVDVNGIVFGATIENGGQLTLKDGGCALSNVITVNAGGNVTIEGGKVDLGAAFHLAGGTITVNGALQGWEDDSGNEWGATRHWFVYDLDKLSAAPSGVMISDYTMLQCNPEFTANMSADQKNVSFKLLGNASGFDRYVSLNVEGHDYQEYLRLGQECGIGDSYYSLAIVDDVLTLTVSATRPVHAPYVWADIEEPTTGSVTVTASFDETAKTREYSLDGVTWKTYKKAVKVTENGTIYFRGKDSKGNTSPVVSYEVTNIEKSGPEPQPEPDKPEPKPDDGAVNGSLVDKAGNVNEHITESAGTAIEEGAGSILLDEDVDYTDESGVTYDNFVGQGDEFDYAKITLDKAAKLSFEIDATDAVKFSICTLNEKPGKKTTMKSLQATTLKNGGSGASTKQILLEAGEYYISMQSTNAKKGGSAFYNVAVNESGDSASRFYSDGDDGRNNYLYDKKRKPEWNPYVLDAEAIVLNADSVGGFVQIDDVGIEGHGELTNFVGFGDATDVRKVEFASAANVNFDVTLNGGAAKFFLYAVDAKGKLKTVASNTLKAGGAALKKPVLVEAGTYYLAFQSSNAKKGDEVYYNVKVNADSRFYSDGDTGLNNYDSKAKSVKAEVNANPVDLTQGEFVIDGLLDGTNIDHNGYHNFVGFGDASDIVKINAAAGDTLSLKVAATDAVSLTLYGLKNGKVTSIKSVKSKNGVAAIDNFTFTEKNGAEFFVGVEATNAKKGEKAWYNVEVVSFSSGSADALSMPETDTLGISDALSFGDYGTDALADVSASLLAELDDKSAWQSLLA